jgi:EmrB/QacA subfamily drug resistance transporter
VYERRWWTLGCLCLSLVLISANFSSLNVNLPLLQRAFNASTSGLQWAVDAYGLLFAAMLLPAGALADRYGRKTALQFGLAVIGAGSMAAMVSGSTWQLIACRAVMGLGAAFVMPGTLSILTNVFPVEERGSAIAIWAGFAGFGGVVGPITSGWLLEHFYWGSAFAINVPIVVAALAVGLWLVPNSKHPDDTVLDPPGVVLVVAGLFALLYGVIDGPERGWTSTPILGGLLLGTALLAAFVVWELRTAHPMLDMRLFANRSFSVGAGTITMQYFALWGLFFILAQYLEIARGYAPLSAAFAIVPIAVLSMVGAPLSAPLVRRFGPRAVVGTGLLSTATGLAVLSRATPFTPLAVVLAAEVLIGLGIGQTTAPSTTLIMTNVPVARAGVGSAVNDVSRELGGALGIAVLGSILSSAYRGAIGARLPAGLPSAVTAGAHRSVSDALLAVTNPHAHVPASQASAVVEAVRATFSAGFGAAMAAGAAMLVACSALVWAFQHGPQVTSGAGTGKEQARDERVHGAAPRQIGDRHKAYERGARHEDDSRHQRLGTAGPRVHRLGERGAGRPGPARRVAAAPYDDLGGASR